MSRSIAPITHQSTARPTAAVVSDQSATVSGWGAPAATVNTPTATATASTVSSGSSGWGKGGTTLADKIKLAEIQKLLPLPAPVVEVVALEETEEVSPSESVTSLEILLNISTLMLTLSNIMVKN